MVTVLISEMSHEQLQDYALQLETDKKALESKVSEHEASIQELNILNKNLQKRNNDLFMKVEQQTYSDSQESQEQGSEQVQTCEEFAQNLLKEIRK